MESVQIFGIDLGSLKTTVASYSMGGVETVRSATGGVFTPTSLAFGKPERLYGEASHSQARSNCKNTADCFTRFYGLHKTAEDQISKE
jgi:molecular chaperone DnaK (HSP70)